MIPYSRPKPYPRVNSLKTIPFTAAHTYIAHKWQYPPGFPLFPQKRLILGIPSNGIKFNRQPSTNKMQININR